MVVTVSTSLAMMTRVHCPECKYHMWFEGILICPKCYNKGQGKVVYLVETIDPNGAKIIPFKKKPLPTDE